MTADPRRSLRRQPFRGAAVLCSCALVLTACGGDDDTASPSTVTVTQRPDAGAATSVADAAVTTKAAAKRTSTPKKKAKKAATAEPTQQAQTHSQGSASGVLTTDPGLYADEWVRAWGLGQDEIMATYGDRRVNQALSGTAGGGQWARDQVQHWAPGETMVSYRHNLTGDMVGLVLIDERVAIGARHAIFRVFDAPAGAMEWTPVTDEGWGYAPDASDYGDDEGLPGANPNEGVAMGFTTDPKTYADIFVRAWGRGDRVQGDQYAAAGGMFLFDQDGVGGKDWSYFGQSGSTVSYQDQGGNMLVIVLDLDRVARGASDGVTNAYVE